MTAAFKSPSSIAPPPLQTLKPSLGKERQRTPNRQKEKIPRRRGGVYNRFMVVMSTDCTSSSNASMASVMSSTPTCRCRLLVSRLAGWLAHQLVGWVGSLDWLVGWLIGRLVDRSKETLHHQHGKVKHGQQNSKKRRKGLAVGSRLCGKTGG